MESPVVVDKPPEYHGSANERGFPFDEDESASAWSDLAARHPDIAARLRQRPAAWPRKRRPSSQDHTDFADNLGFDRFGFDDIPPEFREHFPSHFAQRFPRDEPSQRFQREEPPQRYQREEPSPQQHSATQTEPEPPAPQDTPLPQYGLRNTVDLGKSQAGVDADERGQRSVSAPPESRPAMSQPEPPPEPAHVRHIPIFVEGRDEPVINRGEPVINRGEPVINRGEPANNRGDKPAPPAPHPPPQPHPHEREQYFDDGPMNFHAPTNFSRAFGTPFGKGFRPGPQPFQQQKAYPQAAFNRAASPPRAASPRAPHEEPFVKVPVHHEPRAPPPPPQQQAPPTQQQAPPTQQKAPPTQPQAPPPQEQHEPSPPPQKPSSNDPITVILSIQTDVLNLMTEVENFTGTKKDKRYLFLDEMLTRNLIKLDNIETDGKENIRQARKEAIKCIQKCIAVLEAKADNRGAAAAPAPVAEAEAAEPAPAANGDVEETKESATAEPPPPAATEPPAAGEPAPDTRPDTQELKADKPDKKPSPKKNVKKRDKSKDKESKDKVSDSKKETVDSMQVDDKGDNKTEAQGMEVDGAASQ